MRNYCDALLRICVVGAVGGAGGVGVGGAGGAGGLGSLQVFNKKRLYFKVANAREVVRHWVVVSCTTLSVRSSDAADGNWIEIMK